MFAKENKSSIPTGLVWDEDMIAVRSLVCVLHNEEFFLVLAVMVA